MVRDDRDADEPTCVIANSCEYEVRIVEAARAESNKSMRGGARGRASHALWRLAAAELVGTALLLLLTCLPACAAPPGHARSPLHRALAAGLVVALLVQCFDHVSGAQLNPTVTLARALAGHESGPRALALAAAQVTGALLGAAALRPLASGADTAAAAACLTLPAPHVSPYQAMLVEAVLGGCLALANLASWDARNRALLDSWPLRIGLGVAALTLAAGEVTGASMNPARSFAPALLAQRWEHHWVYWAGPLCGSGACAALYSCVWRPPPGAPARGAHASAPPTDTTPAPRMKMHATS